jgi:putative hydrolase of the HAD superfamily
MMRRFSGAMMIVFDLDDTLYLERDFARSGFAAVGALVEARYAVTGFGPACRSLFDAGERRHIFDRACQSLGVPASADLIAELVQAYRLHEPRIALCEDSFRWLDGNSGAQTLGLITDGPEQMQRNKIRALGLERWIPHILPTASLGPGHDKPHPRAFEIMAALAASGEPITMVADNPAKDFLTPRRLGWRTVQILRDGAVHDPVPKDAAHAADVRIRSLDQLAETATHSRG